MVVTTIKLKQLVKPEKNVRIHTANQLKEFKRSIEMFGQIRPIVIDENNVILAGNGLYDALVEMGKETAYVYQYNDLTENQKKKLMIADNKIFSLGIENIDTLNSFLSDLEDDLDVPGFDENLLRQMVADAEDVTNMISGYGILDDGEIEDIKNRSNNENVPEDKDDATPAESGTNIHSFDSQRAYDDTSDTSEVKRFVVCPKCGEKIWL